MWLLQFKQLAFMDPTAHQGYIFLVDVERKPNTEEYILPYDCGELHKKYELESAIEIKTVDGSAFPATLLRDYPMDFEHE